MSHAIKVADTNTFMYFRAYNTDNTALLTLTSATTALALNVYRAGSTDVAISSLSDKATPDATHADGAIYQIGGSNLYSVDVPDAAVATQVPSVMIEGSFTGGFIDGIPHPLVGYDGTDAVRIGMTALPNAAADAAGGLVISDAGGFDMDAITAPLIADAVHDEAMSGHTTAGTFGLFVNDIYDLQITGITTGVETRGGKHSVAATVMMSTNAALSESTLTAKRPSDDTTFNTYTVTVDASASNITGMS